MAVKVKAQVKKVIVPDDVPIVLIAPAQCQGELKPIKTAG
jgi:hypothetical protein